MAAWLPDDSAAAAWRLGAEGIPFLLPPGIAVARAMLVSTSGPQVHTVAATPDGDRAGVHLLPGLARACEAALEVRWAGEALAAFGRLAPSEVAVQFDAPVDPALAGVAAQADASVAAALERASIAALLALPETDPAPALAGARSTLILRDPGRDWPIHFLHGDVYAFPGGGPLHSPLPAPYGDRAAAVSAWMRGVELVQVEFRVPEVSAHGRLALLRRLAEIDA